MANFYKKFFRKRLKRSIMEEQVKIAYVIAAHKNPKQFSRLVKRLDGDHADFYIHIDKKVHLENFKAAIDGINHEKVNFLKQYNATWSEFGIVKAEIEALKSIVNSGRKYDFIILLSGQDYPIKSNEYIKDFFKKNIDKSFIESFSMPFDPWPNGGMDRINRYHFKLLNKSFAFPPYKNPKKRIDKLLNLLFSFYFKRRQLPGGMKPFGGEHWWNFNWPTAKFIVQYLSDHPEYVKFHKYSFCADEMFFQTLLLNSQNEAIFNNIVNDDLRYYDWSEGNDSPKTFTILDLEILLNSKKLFARKFDINIDECILDELDKIIKYKFQNK